MHPRLWDVTHCFVHRFVAASGLCILLCVGSVHAASTAPQPRSPAEYRDHLRALDQLIAQCQQYIDASHCNADAVGPDDIVTVSQHARPRLIPYGWLRRPMELIGERKISPADAKALLKDAAQRIQLEQSEAPGASSSGVLAISPRDAERSALTAILTRPEFRHTDRS